MGLENEITRINKLTFGELRNELANCNDPVRQYIIRNLMLVRYKQHLENKEVQQQMKKDYRKNQLKKIKKRIENKYVKKEHVSLESFDDSEIFDHDKELKNINDKVQELNELNNDNPWRDEILNNIPEYNKDKTNKNLMSRLQNDIDINRLKDNTIHSKKINKDFVPPFADETDDQYASFNGAFKTRETRESRK
ncbi:MAG: hypothetical protein MUO21_03065 [Nitrososphaeraceae archaeon]|nr:hypothetical protein [Nitrososphaeraceae archaeon]